MGALASRARIALTALALAALALAAPVPGGAQQTRAPVTRRAVDVQLGTAIRPETVTVGQHFTVTIRVRVPTGAQLRFPARPDTMVRVDTAAPPARTDVHGSAYDESTVHYVLAAWDTGAQALGLDDVVVATPAGDRMIPLAALRVFVRSVLPADTTLRVPKPPRAPVAVSVFDWRPLVIAAAILALAALIAWLVWRWRRRAHAPLTPYAWAERELERIAQTGWDTTDPTRYGVAVTEVLRGYLSRTFPVARLSETTSELAASLQDVSAIPGERAIPLLDAADLVKFAQRSMTTEDARTAARTVREILDETERRLGAERAAAEEARRTAGKSARKAA